jgi:hypothetical protein
MITEHPDTPPGKAVSDLICVTVRLLQRVGEVMIDSQLMAGRR